MLLPFLFGRLNLLNISFAYCLALTNYWLLPYLGLKWSGFSLPYSSQFPKQHIGLRSRKGKPVSASLFLCSGFVSMEGNTLRDVLDCRDSWTHGFKFPQLVFYSPVLTRNSKSVLSLWKKYYLETNDSPYNLRVRLIWKYPSVNVYSLNCDGNSKWSLYNLELQWNIKAKEDRLTSLSRAIEQSWRRNVN